MYLSYYAIWITGIQVVLGYTLVILINNGLCVGKYIINYMIMITRGPGTSTIYKKYCTLYSQVICKANIRRIPSIKSQRTYKKSEKIYLGNKSSFLPTYNIIYYVSQVWFLKSFDRHQILVSDHLRFKDIHIFLLHYLRYS